MRIATTSFFLTRFKTSPYLEQTFSYIADIDGFLRG